MTRIDWRDVDYAPFEKLPLLHTGRGNKGGRKTKYVDTFATFDIETSRICVRGDEHAVCYVWMMYFPAFDLMVTGRTIGDAYAFFKRLSNHLTYCLAVYCHNFAYEFVFLSGVYDFDYESVFALDSRKVCKATMLKKFEFRCSYVMSNMSLDLYTSKYKVAHGKLSGEEFNYKKCRYPWTELTPREWEYCTNDVVGLAECISIELEIGHYNIDTIPLTSTGFVRREVKEAMRNVSRYTVPQLQPSYHVFTMLRAGFRGGDVHANRYYADRVIPDVKSADRSSSYPDVLCNCLVPMSKWIEEKDLTDKGIDRAIERGRALIMTIQIRNCRLKNPRWPDPYLAKHKCEVYEAAEDGEFEEVKRKEAKPGQKMKEDTRPDRAKFDNGRILYAPLVITTCTDIDYAIITEQYDGEYTITEAYSSRYGSLPYEYIDCIRLYYDRKTSLKGDVSQVPYYEKSKQKLNGLYGMAAESPIKRSSYWYNGLWLEGGYSNDKELQLKKGLFDSLGVPVELQQKMLVSDEQEYEQYLKRAWSLYQWGVWCTAWARLRLYEGVKIASAELPDRPERKPNATSDFLYCDTDSVKYTGEADFSAYNEQRKADSQRNGAYARDAKGKLHYMGVYEPDGEYKRFITLGSKKYAYEDTDGRVHCTIAGVSKKKGAKEIEARGGLDALEYRETLFTFYDAGGSELLYNDEKDYGTLDVDGHLLEITRNVVIRDSTYTLGMPPEYYLLVNACSKEINI